MRQNIAPFFLIRQQKRLCFLLIYDKIKAQNVCNRRPKAADQIQPAKQQQMKPMKGTN